MENNKPKDLGAAWIKTGNHGDYISVSVEINGTKHNFTMFPNKYKQEGSKQPDYRIPAPRQPQDAVSKTDAYQSRIDFVNAEKAKLAKQKTSSNIGAMMEQAGLLDESDIPF